MDENHKKQSNKTGQLRSYIVFMLIMLLLLVAVNIFVYFQHLYAGLVMSAGLIAYLIIVLVYYNIKKRQAVKALIDFALECENLQNRIVDEFSFPYFLMDRNMNLLWGNREFNRLFEGREELLKHKLSEAVPEMTKENLPRVGTETEFLTRLSNGVYRMKIRLISEDASLGKHRFPGVKASDLNRIYAAEMLDETKMQEIIQKQEDEAMVAAMVYIDNYEEAMESVEEVTRSILTAFIDRKINQYFGEYDCIVRKFDRDKYQIIMQNSALSEIAEKHFSILEEVKKLESSDVPITVSMGIGCNQGSFKKNMNAARIGIELALGRGGDQVVVKNGASTKYFGGKRQGIEKNTKVKARVKARALHEFMSAADKVVVMGHKMMDVDAFGAAVGIARLAKTISKKAYIVVDSASLSLKPVIEAYKANPAFDPNSFVNCDQAVLITNEKTLVVVVDTSRPNYTECPQLLDIAKNIVVLDHHRIGNDVIKNSMLSYIEPYASSACEMVAEILQYFNEEVKIRSVEADVMYAGIVVDTDNFVQKTGVRTFEAAAYLRRKGADVTRVRKMFRENMKDYLAKSETIRNVKLLNDYAIAVCPSEGLEMPTIVAAQAANELLNIIGVKASFVLTYYKDEIYISARSIDEVNVQIIMEKMGGGGHLNIAGCQLSGVTIEEAEAQLRNALTQMHNGGEI